MKQTRRPATRHGGAKSLECLGIDITANVTARLVTPEERALLTNSSIAPEQLEQAMSSRLPASLRDEAIWQYHAGRGRGVILRTHNQMFRYMPEGAWDGSFNLRANIRRVIASSIRMYDPVKEAILLLGYPYSSELFRIQDDGALALLGNDHAASWLLVVRRSEGDG